MVHRQEIENQFRKFESALKRLEEVLLIVFEFFILHIINLMLTKTNFFKEEGLKPLFLLFNN